MRPAVETPGLDGCLFASPLGIQQFPVVFAVVNGFQNGFDRKVVLLGHLLGTERLGAECLAIQDLRANAPAHGELLIARAAFWLQVLVADRFRHDLILQAGIPFSHRSVIAWELQFTIGPLEEAIPPTVEKLRRLGTPRGTPKRVPERW